jgi:hypothetical protein
VLEALLEHERAVGRSPEVTEAHLRGQEYLLERRLFRRRSTPVEHAARLTSVELVIEQ